MLRTGEDEAAAEGTVLRRGVDEAAAEGTVLRRGEDEAAAEGTVLRTDEDEADFRVDDDDAFFFGFVITLATYHSDTQYCHQSYISFYKFREVEVKVSISYLDTVLPSFLWFCDVTSNLPDTQHCHKSYILLYKYREVEVKVKNIK